MSRGETLDRGEGTPILSLVGIALSTPGWTRRALLCAGAVLLAVSCGCAGMPGFGIPLGTSGSDLLFLAPPAAASADILEQLMLERVNRARLLPSEEAAIYGIPLDEGIPGQLLPGARQAVAPNETLRSVARRHARDMLDRDYFGHMSPEGLSPFDRMINGGYDFISAGENLAWRGSTGPLDDVDTVELQHEELFVDTPVADRGHRVTMLNPKYRQVGIAVEKGAYTRQPDGTQFTFSYMQAHEFGTPPENTTFIVGVVYRDVNRNGQYDAGEGQPGVTVSLEGQTQSTSVAGGYSFEVAQAGRYVLQLGDGASITVDIEAGDPNQKVDLVDAERVVVNLGLGFLN